MTLNIEGDKHFDRFIPVITERKPDIVCLQEVFAVDLPTIAERLHFSEDQYTFMPMTSVDDENKYNIPTKGEWGIAILTRLDHTSFQKMYYKGRGTIPPFTTPNSVDRGMLFAIFHSKDGESIPLGTTHFTWTGKGESSPEQQRDYFALSQITQALPPHILCGDFNSPRGGETFALFEKLYRDGLPADVSTTIDGSLHYAGDLQLVVDTVFYQDPLVVEQVEVIGGVSDHKAVSFVAQVV